MDVIGWTSIISITLQGTNISPKNGILKMIFLFPRWDMLIPWRVSCCSLKYPNFTRKLDPTWLGVSWTPNDANRIKDKRYKSCWSLVMKRAVADCIRASVVWDRLAHIGFSKSWAETFKIRFPRSMLNCNGVYSKKNVYIYIDIYIHVFKFLCFRGARTGRGCTGRYGIPRHFMSNYFSLILVLIY